MSDGSKSKHITALAKELLDDVELSRLPADQLLLKTSRLARLVGSDEVRRWIHFELEGYNGTDPLSLKYMGKTGRWIDFNEKKGWWGPLAQQEATIRAHEAKLSTMRTPDASGDYAVLAVHNAHTAMGQTANLITTLSGIRSRVLALLHKFITETYYEKLFEGVSDSIFEKYRLDIDALIAEACGDVLEKIPTAMDRLSEGDTEAISQALTTCRRIIDTFADAIFPPSDRTATIDGNELKLDASKVQNRINAFVSAHCESKSRVKRIRQNLANLYDRVSSGVHNDVTPEEARALFLNTYLFLGEVLHLRGIA